jgi:hypothetical protein
MPANTSLKLVTPTTEIRTVPAGRKPNAAYRSREHLTEAEVANGVPTPVAGWGVAPLYRGTRLGPGR